MTRAQQYIETAWGNDGGAVAETARLGRLADADLRDLAEQYGDDAAAIAAEIIAECQRLRTEVAS